METWQSEALARFPELEERIREADDPWDLWAELELAFTTAYEEPRDEEQIERIYQFAFWCLAQYNPKANEGKDVPMSAVAFIQDIPRWPAARQDIPRWFTRDKVASWEEIWAPVMGLEEYQRVLRLYDREPTADKRQYNWWRLGGKSRGENAK